MNDEKLETLNELTLKISLDLNILHNALKYDDNELETCAVSYFVEKIYHTANEVRNLF